MNLREAKNACLEYDSVITAGPSKDEVSDFGHPLHKIVQFSDTIFSSRGGPTYENVVEMIEFGKDVPKLLVHCHAGISRSTATAWGVAIINGENPLDAFLALRENHPEERGSFGNLNMGRRTFSPNQLIVQHLEQYFNLGNTLSKILRQHSEYGSW